MGFLRKLFGKEPNLLRLLSARILFDGNDNYYAQYTYKHPELKQYEYVRIVLHYYSNVMYMIGNENDEMRKIAGMLVNLVEKITKNGIQKNNDILEKAGLSQYININSSIEKNKNIRTYELDFYFIDTVNRQIITKIPEDGFFNDMLFTVVVLILETMREIDEEGAELLGRSLGKMNEIYEQGANYADLQVGMFAPINAYVESVF